VSAYRALVDIVAPGLRRVRELLEQIGSETATDRLRPENSELLDHSVGGRCRGLGTSLKVAGKDLCLLPLLSNCIVGPLRTMGSMSPSRGLASNRLATRIRPLGCFVIVS